MYPDSGRVREGSVVLEETKGEEKEWRGDDSTESEYSEWISGPSLLSENPRDESMATS